MGIGKSGAGETGRVMTEIKGSCTKQREMFCAFRRIRGEDGECAFFLEIFCYNGNWKKMRLQSAAADLWRLLWKL